MQAFKYMGGYAAHSTPPLSMGVKLTQVFQLTIFNEAVDRHNEAGRVFIP